MCCGTTKDIVDRNLRDKTSKLHDKVQQIRKLVRDDRMSHLGMIKVAALLIQSVVVPTITYSCQAWIQMTRDQYGALENTFRDSIAQILGLPPKSNHEVLLHEVGQYHMESWVDGLKIKYIQKKIHEKKRGLLYQALMEELILDRKGGIMEDITNLCNKYSLPNVLLNAVEDEYVNEAVKRRSRLIVFNTVKMLKSRTGHFSFP